MLSERIARLSGDFPACFILAYVDLGSGVTLLSHQPEATPREALDELSGEGALTLALAERLAGDTAESGAPVALKTDGEAVYVFLRSAQDPSDALLCVCQPEIALDRFLPAARIALDGAG